MLLLAADENFDNDILRAVQRRQPAGNITRVQDVGLSGVDDPGVLAWAARERRVLLTHDVTTLIGFAYERVRAGEAMPGVFAVRHGAQMARIIEDVLLLIECSTEGEWEGRVLYLPLRDSS